MDMHPLGLVFHFDSQSFSSLRILGTAVVIAVVRNDVLYLFVCRLTRHMNNSWRTGILQLTTYGLL